MFELSGFIKFSIFMLVLCPVVSVLIYISPWWKRYVDKFDNMNDME